MWQCDCVLWYVHCGDLLCFARVCDVCVRSVCVVCVMCVCVCVCVQSVCVVCVCPCVCVCSVSCTSVFAYICSRKVKFIPYEVCAVVIAFHLFTSPSLHQANNLSAPFMT